MSIHKKQFVICNYEVKKDNFINVKLSNGLFFNYSKDLNVERIYTENPEDEIYILGHAFQVNSDKQSPIDEIKKKEYNTIDKCYESWSGRWILIYNGEIHMDACGTLGIFYTTQNDNVYISSSCAILKELCGINKVKNLFYIEHGKGMDWYPGPKSILENINRLLPSQIIKLSKNKVEINNREIISKCYDNISDEEKINLICKYLDQLMKNISREYVGDILLPLTAGYDSRTILSIMLKSNIKFSTLTLEHSGILNSDVDIPNQLAKEFEFDHKYIKRNKILDKNKLIEFDNHTLGNCVDEDRLFYAHNQFPNGGNKLLLRGGIWEVSRGFYDDILIGQNDNSIDEKLKCIRQSFHGFKEHSLHEESLALWLKYIETHKESIDWRDRLYLEQRVGGWLSSIEQALDLTDFDRIHPLNSKILISLLMSLSKEIRKDKNHQVEIIRLCEPKLLQYPFNKKTFNETIRNKIKIVINIYDNYGLVGIKDKIKLKLRKLIN